MKVNIKTCTPIWTGGVESGKCDRIHETSIIGSLRWWMEVLVRGMGGQVCDPTKHKCLYDPKKPNNGLCKVCEIFGATGWKRRFRLEVEDIEISDAKITHPIAAERIYTNDQGEQISPTWYFKDSKPPNAPKKGTFIIKIQSLNLKFKPEIIAELIQFIANYSALGARSQMGFGVIKVENNVSMQALYDWLISISEEKKYQDLPSLQNVFLAKIQMQMKSLNFDEQATFNLKYDLRQLFRSDKNLHHFVMGTIKGDRIAAKVKISRIYKDKTGNNTVNIWGWIPNYNDNWNKNIIVDTIHKYLKDNYEIQDWREMESNRDLVTQNQTDIQAFMRSLLQLQDGTHAV